MIVIPYPGVEYLFFIEQTGLNRGLSHSEIPYFLTELILPFMLLRLKFVSEVFHGPNSFLDVYSKKIYRRYNKKLDYFMFYKMLLIEKPFVMSISILFTTIAAFSLVMQVFEMPYRLKIGDTSLVNYA